jgi:excinuclease ABC subunit C
MSRGPKDGTMQKRLFTDDFEGFGPSRFRPANETPTVHQLRGSRAARLKRGVKQHAPKEPGVYGMIDARSRLIYVGKAKNLRSRLLSYFRENSRLPKAGKIVEQTRRLVWEQTGDELAALLRELELIQRLRPKLNVLGVPGLQRHHYVCLGKAPAPYIYIAPRPTGKELAAYGPFVRRDMSEDAARRLNDWFKLRDCPRTIALRFAEQGELFDHGRGAQCLRHELELCSGPCNGGCSRKEYYTGVRGAKAFLDGGSKALLTSLRERMDAAAAALEFARAVSLRDKLRSLQWLDDRLAMLRTARDQSSFVYPLAGSDGTVRWYLIHRGEVRAVTFAPSATTAACVEKLVAATFIDQPAPTVLSDVAVDSVLLVTGWFRARSEERAKLLTREEARRVCRWSEDEAPPPRRSASR